MSLDEAEKYFSAHVIDYLKHLATDGTPWVFLCASATIEYLSKLAAGKDDGASGFKTFVRTYLPKAYSDFAYRSGLQDLPEQMYHVLRCGIVHSFSLIPDDQARRRGGRDRSVVMSHEDEHLSQYSSAQAPDACCLKADAFVADIETAMNRLFDDARVDTTLSDGLTKWLKEHPPIAGNI